MKRLVIYASLFALLFLIPGCGKPETTESIHTNHSVSITSPTTSVAATTSLTTTTTTAALATTATTNKTDPITETTPSTMTLKTLGNLSYYLYTPRNPTENMPLILYLHGGTNKNADVTALLTTDGFPNYLYDGYYGDLRAYVAVPKLNKQYKGWGDVTEQITALLDHLTATYSIDTHKLALTGHSMGGTGTYQLQINLPDTFACIAPMSGSVQNTADTVNALSKTNVWAFVGTADTVIDPNSGRAIIKALQENGASATLTELRGATHRDVPALAYKNPRLIQWLVSGGQ